MEKHSTIFFSILTVCSTFFYSCDETEYWFQKEGGSLLWINSNHEDQAIKRAVKNTLENSTIIVAQIPWSPDDTSFFNNAAWYFSLARDHGKTFMISVDWQKDDRSGTTTDWSFEDKATSEKFKKDMIKLINTYNPDYLNLGVEVNYYALTSPNGFRSFASIFREIKEEVKTLNSLTKIGLSYQLELLYGHHLGWKEEKTFSTLDNLLGDIDFLGISTYPNIVSSQDESDISYSVNFLDSLSLKYEIPIGISETAVNSDLYKVEDRNKYIQTVYEKANKLDLKFVVWGTMIDATKSSSWIDNAGLLNKDGYPKDEFSTWQKFNTFYLK